MKRLLILALAASTRSFGQAAPVESEADRKPLLQTHGSVLIRGAKVLTVTNGTLPKADVLVRNGKIVQIGTNIAPPAGVAVVDATGLVLSPGIVDAHVHRGIDDTNEGSDSITCEVRILDVLNPRARNLWQAVASGETSGLMLHGSANCVGGESLVAKFKYGRANKELPIPDAPRMVKFALGENVTRSSGNNTSRFPRTRMGVQEVYRRAFTEARKYIQAWDAYNRAKASDPKAIPPRKDLRLETLADILRGKVWVQCHSYRADEMLMMVRLSQEFGFKIGAMQHALEGYKIAPELAAAGVGISTFGDLWMYKVEAYDAIPYNAALSTRAGVLTSINTDGTGGTTAINIDAAKSMRYGGLSEDEVMRMLTINPATEIGIAKRTGSIEVGKDADLVLWKGHPLSVYSKVMITMIDGEVYFQRRDKFGVDPTSKTSNDVAPVAKQPIPQMPPIGSTYALVGGTAYPVSSPPIENATVIVKDGKISAIGTGIPVPSGAIKVDTRGQRVYPGFIDAGTRIGLEEVQSVSEMNDSRELGEFQPDLSAITAIQVESAMIPITRAAGILTAVTRPTGITIAGRSAIIDLAGGTFEELALKARGPLAVSFPSTGGGAPFELGLLCEDEFLSRYRDLGAVPKELDLGDDLLSGQRRNQQDGPADVGPLSDYFNKALKYYKEGGSGNLQYDALKPYLTGQESVFVTVRSAASIRAALDFAEKFKLKVILVGAAEAWREAKRIAAMKVPVILEPAGNSTLFANGPSQDWMPYDTPYVVPALLERAGITFCFQSNDNAQCFGLPFRVGMSCAFGLSPDRALRAMTLDAAKTLGVEDKIGSLQVGKQANIFVTDGDPFEPSSTVRYVWIKGKPASLENRFTQLRDRYLARLTPAQQAAFRK